MLDYILNETKASILVIENRLSHHLIIGAPHHTVGGVKNMPCKEHEAGDENTGFIASYIAEKLQVTSIIACNYQIDPNKSLQTDYSAHIIKSNPKYLIEIHGHGAKNINDYSIEISSGTNAQSNLSKEFASTFERNLRLNEAFKSYKVYEDFTYLRFKATKSETIITDRWTPFHIELPPSLRIDARNCMPAFLVDFNNILVDTINTICV